MNIGRNVRATLSRLGESHVPVLEQQQNSTNEFNNPEHEWVQTTTTRCVRSFPNRNTQQDGRGGPYNEDNPLFIFEHEEAPPQSARIVYDGVTYELQSKTVYETHISIFGERVTE